jgi:hypothetical protein
MNKMMNAERNHGRESCGASRTMSPRSNDGSSPARSAEYPRNSEPRSASAMPTEPMSKYFHVASSERGLRWK